MVLCMMDNLLPFMGTTFQVTVTSDSAVIPAFLMFLLSCFFTLSNFDFSRMSYGCTLTMCSWFRLSSLT